MLGEVQALTMETAKLGCPEEATGESRLKERQQRREGGKARVSQQPPGATGAGSGDSGSHTPEL